MAALSGGSSEIRTATTLEIFQAMGPTTLASCYGESRCLTAVASHRKRRDNGKPLMQWLDRIAGRALCAPGNPKT